MALIQVDPESNGAKEEAKWEQHFTSKTVGGLRPGNAYVYRPFPKMIYCARQTASGKWSVGETHPSIVGFQDHNNWSRACEAADRFNTTTNKIVNSESELTQALESGEGWRESPEDALAYRASLDREISNAAAERAYDDRRMSEKAQSERKAYEKEHFGHAPEIPEKPLPPKRKVLSAEHLAKLAAGRERAKKAKTIEGA